MKTIQHFDLDKLLESGEILEQDGHGPKVIRLHDERYFKIFYHKTLFSLATLRSRAQQFATNARKLKQRGITTVGILDVFRLKKPTRDCVCYHGVPGQTVRSALQKKPKDSQFSQQLGAYIAQLHNAGVMFRSLHFGNIIQMPSGELALIDIADMRVNVFTLNAWQRQRNFQHVFRYQQDIALVDLEQFIDGYHQQNNSKGRNKHYLEQAMRSARPQITQ